jgi:short subunit dehydrogenase-like uncharacterized protein
LVAEELVAAKARPVLAGPSHQNLAALGVLLGKGLDIAVADSRHPQSVLAMLKKDDVLVTSAGPFSARGRPAAEAAIVAGVTYIDCAAEAPFLRSVFEELSPHARDAGIAMVPAFGFLHVAGIVAAELALDGIEGATSVDVGYFITGETRHWRSAGITASIGAAALLPQHAWRDGELVTVPTGDRERGFVVDGQQRFAVSSGGLEQLTLPRAHPSLTDVDMFLGGPRTERGARVRGGVMNRAGRVPGLQQTVAWLAAAERHRRGPEPDERARAEFIAVAIAEDAEGRTVRTVNVRGYDIYAITAKLLAGAALRAAAGDITATGALSPVQALGIGPLRDLCASAGLSVVYAG